ncbi:AMIN-like domain-containing (lipo)protein [Streptomyces sp. NPDC004288]|uniref:AMIN-like domain-containing (lipo)protein n=1 Tax=unclassified Streptomyces TaxID=2593676 RepID=UPI0036B9EB0E
MHHRHTLAAVAAGILLTAGTGATLPAGAAAAPAPRSPATALVVGTRWSGHTTFDRLVIDVRGKLPPVTVHQVRSLRYDPSGKKVPLPGKYFLEIRLSPAAAHDGAGRSVHHGPRLVRIALPALKGVALSGDFEGVVTVGAAFDTAPAFKTLRLHAPERFVVDIAHPVGCRG